MKKKFSICVMLLLALAFAGCRKNDTGNAGTINEPSPASDNANLQEADEKNDDSERKDDVKQNVKLVDFYPFMADVEYVYTGEGNEYAAYRRFTDFISEDGSRIQIRTNNGATETVSVIEIKDGKVSVIKKMSECYYRDNVLDAPADDEVEILLMEPLVKGTEWTLADGRKRYISGTDVELNVPLGQYRALEVTTENSDGIVKDYYASGIGLIKSQFVSADYEIISELSKINENSVYTKSIDIFYPGVDENIYVQSIDLSFKTGDVTRKVLSEAIKDTPNEDLLPLASTKTKINSLYLGSDGIAYIDFSDDFVEEMSVGSGYELLILRCIANTVGNYYGTDRVYLTVDGKPYRSGHIEIEEGDTIQVDLNNVIRKN